MQATLKILIGPEAGRIIHLKSGQVAQFGRTEWCDFAFPYDPRLADIHFSIETTDESVSLIDLSDGAGVLVDGDQSNKCQLRGGQKIQAGSLIFEITTELLFQTSGSGPVSVAQQNPTVPPPPPLARILCEPVDLTDSARQLMDDSIEILPYIDNLTAAELFPDAIRAVIAWLGKRKAIGWGADCIAMACGDRLETQAELLTVVRTWVESPTEDNRRLTVAAADSTDAKLPASWLARAAGWSGGSLAPPELPVVPPAEQLTSKTLLAALLLAAVFRDPAQASTNYNRFIESGKQLGQTRLAWEEARPGEST
jgi:hypothetical protein